MEIGPFRAYFVGRGRDGSARDGEHIVPEVSAVRSEFYAYLMLQGGRLYPSYTGDLRERLVK